VTEATHGRHPMEFTGTVTEAGRGPEKALKRPRCDPAEHGRGFICGALSRYGRRFVLKSLLGTCEVFRSMMMNVWFQQKVESKLHSLSRLTALFVILVYVY